MSTKQYPKILLRSNALIEELTENMQRWEKWSDEQKKYYNIHEKTEHGRYIFAQVKALIREQDTGSPFLDICAEEDEN